MSSKKIFYTICLLFSINRSHAQVIDNTPSFRNSLGDKYVRFHYDNDVFTGSDDYYTQGMAIEYAIPTLKRFFTSALLLKPKHSDITYGLRNDNFGYTPTTLASDSILHGDRPFCGNITFSAFAIAVDTLNQQILSSTFIVGLMGEGTGGKEFQTYIHRLTDDTIPQGWQNQIRNDIILDYQVNYEKKICSYNNNFLLNSTSLVRVGTHNDKIVSGFNCMIGNFNNRYLSTTTTTRLTRKKVQYYFYEQVQEAIIGYDATLQGGLINKTSPYTISSGDINRFVLQHDWGIVVCFRNLYLEYAQSYLSKEFNTGQFHRWGGFRIGFPI